MQFVLKFRHSYNWAAAVKVHIVFLESCSRPID